MRRGFCKAGKKCPLLQFVQARHTGFASEYMWFCSHLRRDDRAVHTMSELAEAAAPQREAAPLLSECASAFSLHDTQMHETDPSKETAEVQALNREEEDDPLLNQQVRSLHGSHSPHLLSHILLLAYKFSSLGAF